MGHEQPFLRRACRGFVLVALGVGLSALASSGQVAHADNTLTGSNPADGASLPASPVSLQFSFAEPLGTVARRADNATVARYALFRVSDPVGDPLAP